MKIGIYSPYLDTAGGGEKYMLLIAESLIEGNQVDILLDKHLNEIGIENIKSKNQKFHGLDLSKFNFIPAPLGVGSSLLQRNKFFKNYDWIFINSDGSWFYSTAKNSIIHFQIPFQNIGQSYLSKLKLKSWKLAIYNSEFTKKIIDHSINIKGQVVYPPVDTLNIKPLKKKKQILNVGRFVNLTKVKKQHIMVEAFKKLVDKNQLNDWSFHLVGGVLPGDEDFIQQLKKDSQGYKIFFYPNANLDTVRKLYGESKIYWHAMGYQEDDPSKFEHFGISTVEAMSAGCVPVVINKGGQTEIVEPQKSGFLWDSLDELIEKTLQLITNPKLFDTTSKQSIIRAQEFSQERFIKQIKNIVYNNG